MQLLLLDTKMEWDPINKSVSIVDIIYRKEVVLMNVYLKNQKKQTTETVILIHFPITSSINSPASRDLIVVGFIV